MIISQEPHQQLRLMIMKIMNTQNQINQSKFKGNLIFSHAYCQGYKCKLTNDN